MKLSQRLGAGLAAAALFASTMVAAQDSKDRKPGTNSIQRVLLISVDGMHAVDFLNCANGISTANSGQPYCPNLASLQSTAINYVAASTSKPSDSFPGLMTIMTGSTPRRKDRCRASRSAILRVLTKISVVRWSATSAASRS